MKRSRAFVTKSNFLISISLQSDGENISYIKLRLFALTESIELNKSLRNRVAKIKGLISK